MQPPQGNYHLVGIAGVGMSALAQALLNAGHDVSGSDRFCDQGRGDLDVLAVLRRAGVQLLPQDGSGATAGLTGVVVSSAIEADNPDIGLMAVLLVGMAEASSCEVSVYEGQRLDKGDPIGMFHFGGSTHCLIFRSGVELVFDLHGQKPGLQSNNIKINAAIATVS